MSNLAVEVKDLSFSYTSEPLLKSIDFELKAGETVALAGGNGSGKSTFLKLIINELQADKGSIKLFGEDNSLPSSLARLSYVPQVQSIDNIPFPITCEEMLSLTLYRDMGLLKIPRKSQMKQVEKILQDFNLLAYQKVPFNELSGGLRQRIMIAGAMLKTPELLILDEPTSGVDFESKVDFLQNLEKLSKQKNLTVLLVTHEMDFISEHISLDHSYYFEEGVIKHV